MDARYPEQPERLVGTIVGKNAAYAGHTTQGQNTNIIDALRSLIESEIQRIYNVTERLNIHFDRITGPIPRPGEEKTAPTPIQASLDHTIGTLGRAIDDLQAVVSRTDR